MLKQPGSHLVSGATCAIVLIINMTQRPGIKASLVFRGPPSWGSGTFKRWDLLGNVQVSRGIPLERTLGCWSPFSCLFLRRPAWQEHLDPSRILGHHLLPHNRSRRKLSANRGLTPPKLRAKANFPLLRKHNAWGIVLQQQKEVWSVTLAMHLRNTPRFTTTSLASTWFHKDYPGAQEWYHPWLAGPSHINHKSRRCPATDLPHGQSDRDNSQWRDCLPREL